MQSLGLFNGSFFKPRPFSDMYPSSTRESAGKQGKESVVKLENHDLNSATPSLKGRVVGIVKLTDLESCKQESGSYLINKTLKEHLNTSRDIKNLPKDFEKQYVLPFGSGVALSEDLILTAGHNIHTAPGNIRVIQYQLEGIRLPTSSVYEVESYISKQDYFDEDESDPRIYANNLLEGEWAVLKLQKPLKGVSGALPIATTISDLTQGLKTFTLGHPYGLPLKKAEGKIDTVLQKNHIVRYKAETLPGMSGGPVFDEKTGKLIGLHVRGNINYQFDDRGAVEFVVMLPHNPKIEEMGVYGTFFQNVIPVVEKIGKPTLTYQPTSLSGSQINLFGPIGATSHLTNSNSQFSTSSTSSMIKSQPISEADRIRAEIAAKREMLEKLKREEEEKENLRVAQEAKEREEKELRAELAKLDNDVKQIQSRLVQPPISPIVPPKPNGSSTLTSSSSISSPAKENQIIPVPSMAFGKTKWAEYFGDVGVEPPLPANIQSILNGPCPIWSGKKVRETHLLTLIPEKINDKPLTINRIGKLVLKDFPGVQDYRQSKGTGYRNILDQVAEVIGNKEENQSYWVLMTKDIIPDTRNTFYVDSKKILEKLPSQNKQTYKVPTVREIVVSLLMNYYQSGKKERLYSDNPWTWSFCQEEIGGSQITVGGFTVSGLDLSLYFSTQSHLYGLAGSLKFI